MNKKIFLPVVSGIIILASITFFVFRNDSSNESAPEPTQAEIYKLKHSYTSDAMTFQYPDGYVVEREPETDILLITGDNSRIEIVSTSDAQDLPFGVEDGQTQDYADRNIPKDIKTLTGASGSFVVKLFYQMNDRKMKELLDAVVDTIEVR